jgi:hypothetical protein
MARVSPAPTNAKLRPLIARDGASFRCFGDGLCCTDIHALGVLTRSEVRDLRARRKLSVVYSDDIEGYCVAPVEHRCTYLGLEGCSIHAEEGSAAKPAGCRRFPYGLISTPFGGRVTTEHRCPCRTLGDRPSLSLTDAEMSLRDRAGRLEVDRIIPARIELQHGKRVAFSVYAAIEAKLIARLNAAEPAEQVLAANVLPPLAERGWASVAVEHIETRDDSAGGEAFGWFGDALLNLASGHTPPKRPRPWHAAFERAMGRSHQQPSADAIYNDWIADEIWMFRALSWAPFDVARAELATRLAVARLIQRWIQDHSVSATQAAAEAVMICELVAEGSEWPVAVAEIEVDPSPAQALT